LRCGSGCGRWRLWRSRSTWEHDARAILILFFASIAAIFVYVDWTILAGLLAIIAVLRAAFIFRRSVRRRAQRHNAAT